MIRSRIVCKCWWLVDQSRNQGKPLKLQKLMLLSKFCWTSLYSFRTLFLLVQPVVLLVGRLFCIVSVHPTRCKVVYSSIFYSTFVVSYSLWHTFLSGIWRKWWPRDILSGSSFIDQRGNWERKGLYRSHFKKRI